MQAASRPEIQKAGKGRFSDQIGTGSIADTQVKMAI
jgi:hypothetical protein